MRLDEIALDESARQDAAVEIFNRFLPKRTEENDRAFRKHVLNTIVQELGISMESATGLYNYARVKSGLSDLGRTADRAKRGLEPVVRGASEPKQLDLFGKAPVADPRQGELF